MAALILALLIVVPIVELAAFIVVADQIGALTAAALLIVCSIGGIALVKRQGLGVWRKAQTKLDAGEVPTTELLNGLLLLVAGVLMAVPGFVTDALGLLLLLPPVRALVRTLAFRRFEQQMRGLVVTGPSGVGFGTTTSGRIRTGPSTYGVVDVREVRDETNDGDPHGGVGELDR